MEMATDKIRKKHKHKLDKVITLLNVRSARGITKHFILGVSTEPAHLLAAKNELCQCERFNHLFLYASRNSREKKQPRTDH